MRAVVIGWILSGVPPRINKDTETAFSGISMSCAGTAMGKELGAVDAGSCHLADLVRSTSRASTKILRLHSPESR